LAFSPLLYVLRPFLLKLLVQFLIKGGDSAFLPSHRGNLLVTRIFPDRLVFLFRQHRVFALFPPSFCAGGVDFCVRPRRYAPFLPPPQPIPGAFLRRSCHPSLGPFRLMARFTPDRCPRPFPILFSFRHPLDGFRLLGPCSRRGIFKPQSASGPAPDSRSWFSPLTTAYAHFAGDPLFFPPLPFAFRELPDAKQPLSPNPPSFQRWVVFGRSLSSFLSFLPPPPFFFCLKFNRRNSPLFPPSLLLVEVCSLSQH